MLTSCNKEQSNLKTLNTDLNKSKINYNDEWLFSPNNKFRYDDIKHGYYYKSIIDTSKFTNQEFSVIFNYIENKYPLLDFHNGYILDNQFEKDPGYIFVFYIDSTSVLGLLVFLPVETIKIAEKQKIKPDLNFLKKQKEYRIYQIITDIKRYNNDKKLSLKIDSLNRAVANPFSPPTASARVAGNPLAR